ncbi:TIGR03086 family metal-binding protein [Streptomyces litchfieldiae]|uniref:TIGR03086 family metal-binding protein n=1 Tax=Streptomyces litchfieldiae TaxID=3075543 RepID=A0ABU2MM64_9ACTN|nr:TIGR03086 family metal-binding protein [Streptomyces sp. DSM 44938]MDT0342209.1 TIGR03086 family metal-binding protein [Streptomyces sp. DSM 44938]
MTTEPRMLDLEPTARQLAGLLDAIGPDRLADPTPCPDYRVRDLLQHVLGLTLAFRAAAQKDLGPLTDTAPDAPGAPRPALDGDWRGRLRRQLDELVAAWRDPDAWQGDTRAGGVPLPAAVAGQVALNELLLHGWDLARATGQPYAIDDASARASIALLSQETDDAAREGTGFGRVVPVPADAPPLDQAVGLSGRDPSWTPPPATA